MRVIARYAAWVARRSVRRDPCGRMSGRIVAPLSALHGVGNPPAHYICQIRGYSENPLGTYPLSDGLDLLSAGDSDRVLVEAGPAKLDRTSAGRSLEREVKMSVVKRPRIAGVVRDIH